jgi:hypothetical protein
MMRQAGAGCRPAWRRGWRVLALTAASLAALQPDAHPQAAIASLSVRVEGDDGLPLAAVRYVEVVPVDRPWSEPLAEAAVPWGGEPPVFALPAGRFRVLCSASGYGFTYLQSLVKVAAGTSRVVPCRVGKLIQVRGQIVPAGSGRTGPEATILPASLAEEEFPHRLTALGRAHLERNFVAHADLAGGFVLQGVAGSKADYWVLAPGYGPLLLADVVFAPGRQLAPARLVQGGALDLEVRLPAGFPANRYVVGLREPGRGSAVDPLRKDAVHRLLVQSLPADGEVRFAGLPASTFEVWLKPRRGADPALLPVSLGTVRINAGRRTATALEVPPGTALPVQPAQRHLRLSAPVPAAAAAREIEQGLSVVRLASGEAQPVRVEVRVAPGGLEIGGQVPCVPGASYIVGSATLLAEPVTAPPGCGDVAAPLRLHPRAEVRGHFLVPLGMARPRTGVVELAPCGVARDRSTMTYPLRADAAGDWQAAIVAGCTDLTLRTTFAPATLPGVAVEAGQRRDLGEQRLLAGGTLLVRLVSGSPGPPLAGLHLDLVPAAALAQAIAAGENANLPGRAAEQATSADGWARFGPLAEGAYAVRAVPAGGLAVFSEPAVVEEGDETLLNDLLVAKPAEVEVDVEGSLADLPAAGSLQIEAMGVEGCGWRSFQRATVAVDAEHKAHLRLNSGPWTFALVFVDDAGRRRELARQRRDLGPGGLGRVRLRAGTAGTAGAAASAGQ